MPQVVFLLEERSMKAFLEVFIPRWWPGLDFRCIPHEGKQDLEKSIPIKLRGWSDPRARFVIIRDNDGCDCIALKSRLTQLCKESGRTATLVRIACQELEAWYFGEPLAMAKAFDRPSLANLAKKAKYRQPDQIQQPSKILKQLVVDFQKISGARAMAEHLSRETNASESFQVTMSAIDHMARS